MAQPLTAVARETRVSVTHAELMSSKCVEGQIDVCIRYHTVRAIQELTALYAQHLVVSSPHAVQELRQRTTAALTGLGDAGAVGEGGVVRALAGVAQRCVGGLAAALAARLGLALVSDARAVEGQEVLLALRFRIDRKRAERGPH